MLSANKRPTDQADYTFRLNVSSEQQFKCSACSHITRLKQIPAALETNATHIFLSQTAIYIYWPCNSLHEVLGSHHDAKTGYTASVYDIHNLKICFNIILRPTAMFKVTFVPVLPTNLNYSLTL